MEKPTLLRVPLAAAELDISESALYEIMKAGKIRSVLLGPKIRRIPRTELEAYVQSLLDEQYGAPAPEQGAD